MDKKVALWKISWLPASETFIRSQQSNYGRYKASAVGMTRLESSLSWHTDTLLLEGKRFKKIRLFFLRHFGYSKIVEDYFAEKNFDIIHAHFANQSFSVLKIAKKLRIPLVITLHGHDINEAPYYKGWRGVKYRYHLRKSFKESSRIIAVSKAIEARAIELGCPPEKIEVKYTGIDTTTVGSSDTQKKWDVVFIGRLIPIKGADHLLEAAALIEQKYHRRVKIAIVGTGVQENFLKNLVAKYDLDVDFLGFQPREKIPDILNASMIFCGPSHRQKPNQQEGFGMVYLEAALAKIPSVAYKYGGVSEAVSDSETGLLADEGDINALAENLNYLLENPKICQSMGIAAYERTIDSFNIKNCTASIEELYDEVLRENKS